MLAHKLSDKHLLKETKKLVIAEKKLTAQVIEHLQEVESRKLYSDLKYGSLFQYCVQELGYSEDAAYRRINAMRVAVHVPIVKEKIQKGELSLSNTNLFSALNNEVELSKKEQKEIVTKIAHMSKRECERELHRVREHKGVGKRTRPTQVRTENSSHVRVSLSLDHETFSALESIQQHKGFSLEETVTYLVKQERAPQVAMLAKATRPKARKLVGKGRYIPVQIRENVLKRDKNRCVKCSSTYKLQFDHIKPFALGGRSEESNLRLLCQSCNRRQAIKVFGVSKVKGGVS